MVSGGVDVREEGLLERRLVARAAATGFDDLPSAAVEGARRELLWALGTMVGGATDQGSDKVLDFVRALARPGQGRATIIGAGTGWPVDLAGYAGGVYAKALEYEDKHWMGMSHAYAVGVAVVPTALAVAEHHGAVGGRDLLAALAIATDLQIRMVDAAPNAIDTPFNSTYMFGHFGAALTASLLLGGDEQELFDALGLASTQVAGTFQAHHEGTLAVRMQMGACVRNGIHAALLAKQGVSAPHRFLTGRHGVYAAFFGECDEEAAVDGLGTSWRGERLGFKGYPCCAAMHQALDAVGTLVREHGFAADEVAAVEVHGAPSMAITCRPIEHKRRPTNHVEQEFSLPWAVACLLTGGELRLDDFREEALGDERRLALAAKVSGELDAPDDAVHAVITLVDGRRLTSAPIAAPTGHPDNPHSWDELVARYGDCVRLAPPGITAERLDAVKELVTHIEDVENAGEVMELLA